MISILWWNFPVRAQQQKNIGRMMGTDPSNYYKLCDPTTCSNITLIYPFTIPSPCHPSFLEPFCAGDDGTFYITSPQSNNTFRISPANYTADPVGISFVMAYNPLFSCGPISKPNYFNAVPSSVMFPVDYTVGTHFNCTRPIPEGALQGLQNASCLGCPGQDPNNVCYYAPGLATYNNCETYNMYSKNGFNVSAEKDLRGYLQRGFEMRYTKPMECRGCESTGGRCGINPSSPSGSFLCFCPSTIHSFNCSDGLLVDLDGTPAMSNGSQSQSHKVIIDLGIGLGTALFLLFLCVGYFYLKRRWRQNDQNEFCGQGDEALRRYLDGDHDKISASIETFLENYALGKPTRFSYKQLKRYTNNFSHKLGQGGHGSVSKGELPSGLFIAVKLLRDTDQSEAQFLNEARIVGQIHHNHLVRLLGYCSEHSRQVLVYEFMENGSLDRYVSGDDKNTVEKLSWNQLHDIAVGTAKGIMYLHEECRTRIIHCDVKPHNILLDQNFQPKVSDFGLALALSGEKSHVTLTHGTGTPGYAPPEMWWMHCGMVTDKSDVYSFGMVVLEMARSKREIVTNVGNSSTTETHLFPDHQMLLHNDTNPSCSSGMEGGIAQRLELVALRCIQFEQSKRPSMRRVIEMLEGHVVIETPLVPSVQSTYLFEHSSGSLSAPLSRS